MEEKQIIKLLIKKLQKLPHHTVTEHDESSTVSRHVTYTTDIVALENELGEMLSK